MAYGLSGGVTACKEDYVRYHCAPDLYCRLIISDSMQMRGVPFFHE
jgi:hypothetical protein